MSTLTASQPFLTKPASFLFPVIGNKPVNPPGMQPLLPMDFGQISNQKPYKSGDWFFTGPVGPKSKNDPDSMAAVQNRMRQLGYYHGPVTGSWNKETGFAIQRFHNINKTASPNSQEVGMGTANKLFDDTNCISQENFTNRAQINSRKDLKIEMNKDGVYFYVGEKNSNIHYNDLKKVDLRNADFQADGTLKIGNLKTDPASLKIASEALVNAGVKNPIQILEQAKNFIGMMDKLPTNLRLEFAIVLKKDITTESIYDGKFDRKNMVEARARSGMDGRSPAVRKPEIDDDRDPYHKNSGTRVALEVKIGTSKIEQPLTTGKLQPSTKIFFEQPVKTPYGEVKPQGGYEIKDPKAFFSELGQHLKQTKNTCIVSAALGALKELEMRGKATSFIRIGASPNVKIHDNVPLTPGAELTGKPSTRVDVPKKQAPVIQDFADNSRPDQIVLVPDKRDGRSYMFGARTVIRPDDPSTHKKHDVAAWQSALYNAGFYKGPVNGKMDDKTKSAMQTFRELNPSNHPDWFGKGSLQLLMNGKAILPENQSNENISGGRGPVNTVRNVYDGASPFPAKFEPTQIIKADDPKTHDSQHVWIMQTALKNAGFYQGEPTGKVDEKTKEALTLFQSLNPSQNPGWFGTGSLDLLLEGRAKLLPGQINHNPEYARLMNGVNSH